MGWCYLAAAVHGAGVARMKNRSSVYKEAQWSVLMVAMEKYDA